MAGASEPDSVSTKQQRIAELAKQSPQMGFTSLNHHLDLGWMLEAYNRTHKDGTPGVDGQTDFDYGLTLLDNLKLLLERAKAGTYFAPPVRRVYFPKGTGKETRPLGSPTLETARPVQLGADEQVAESDSAASHVLAGVTVRSDPVT